MQWRSIFWLLVVGGTELCQVGCQATYHGTSDTDLRTANSSGNQTVVPVDPSPRQTLSQPTGVMLVAAIQGIEQLPRAKMAKLSLVQAIRLALEENPDVHAAAIRIQIADHALAQAWAEFFPQLGLAGHYIVTNNPATTFVILQNQGDLGLATIPDGSETLDDFHTQVFLDQSVYTGGLRTARAGSAKAQRDAAEFELTAVQNELVFRVAEAYYRLLQARDLVELRRESVRQVQRHLEMVQARWQAEMAVKSDVLTVELRLAEVREGLIRAENQFELAWTVLENTTGHRFEQRLLPDEVPPAPWSQHVQRVEHAVQEAINGRSELAALSKNEHAAEHEVDAATAQSGPTVDFLAQYDVHTGDFLSGNDSFLAGIAVRLNLFDSGRSQGRIRQAEARLHELRAQQQRLLLDIELDVRRAYLQLDDARQRLDVARRAISQAEQNLYEIEAQYENQLATITRLVDAQVAWSNARIRQSNARADVEIARSSLQRAIGQLSNLFDGNLPETGS